MIMKPIRSNADYEAALARVDELMSAPEGSSDAEDLEVLAILVEKYEKEHFPFPDAPASEVLRLYMEENGLTPKDMAKYLGSPSAVSKILGGSKELTVAHVRILSKELGIPAAALVGAAEPEAGVDWTAFPLVEMARRGLFGAQYLRSTFKTLAAAATDLLPTLIGSARLDFACQPRLRQGIKPGPASDSYAIMAWLVEVGKLAQERMPERPYVALTREDLRLLAGLSKNLDGIPAAIRYLEERGVPVVVVPHYKKSKIDGGVVVLDGGRPAIGLSLRFDRVDYFWFTFLHEVAHIVLGHVSDFLGEEFMDSDSHETIEQEANALVEAVTVPAETFASVIPDPSEATLEAIVELAQACGVSVAIVAGRVQYKSGDYRKFARFVGRGKVRKLFGSQDTKEKDREASVADFQ